jgi:flagellar assembly protein FliH
MSSKILTGGEAELCEPMPWSTAGSPAARRPSQPHSSPGGARQAAPSNTHETPDDLRSKIATLEQGIAQARAAGRAEGEAHGRQQAQSELQQVLQKLAAAIHECGDLRARLREQAESDLVRLAVAIARRIVGREIATDPEAITGVVKASLEKLRVHEVLRVRLNPEHKSKVAEYLSRFGATHVEVLGDPACEPGAVVFETNRGNLDASVETQLREIVRGLTDRFKGRTS